MLAHYCTFSLLENNILFL